MEAIQEVKEAQFGKGRKKRIMKENWKSSVDKRMRYSASSFPPPPSCQHAAAAAYQCSQISYQDVRRMHQKFYSYPERQSQNNFILRYVTVSTPVRNRSRKGNMDHCRKKVTTQYFIPVLKNDRVANIPICKQLFIKTLCISRDRVQNLCHKFLQTGDVPCERRVGDRKGNSFTGRRQAVKQFIESIQVLESHYCRSKNVTRQYLPSELSIKGLWSQYQGKHEETLKVKYEFFRQIFVYDYNLGFGSPATDVCSKCLSHKELIKTCREPQKKTELQTELTLHKKSAEVFYEHVRSGSDGEITFSFDCQKNHPIPKIPDQAAYYLRQLYIYNFTICEGSSKDPQTKDKIFSYVWLENEFKKGSNQIVSALYHRLTSTDLSSYHSIKLVADGCGGQNKNTTMIGMLSKFLARDAPQSIKKVTLLFPVVGHSFIPPDRIFGRIETEIKKHTTILTEQDYVKIFKSHATVFHLGDDCLVQDWKGAISTVLKIPGQWHFKLQPCKRIVLKKTKTGNCLVQGELKYNANLTQAKSILKRGKQLKNIMPSVLDRGIPLKKEKLKDLNTLLTKHFGQDFIRMEKLVFFKHLFDQQETLLDVAVEESDCGEIPQDPDGLLV